MKTGTIIISLTPGKERALERRRGPANDLAVRAASEAQAFIQLYECYFDRVYTYLRYRIDNQQDVEDMCAQVFERLLTRLGSYQPELGDFEPWLFALIRNELRSFWRKDKRKPLSLEHIPADAAEDRHPEERLLQQQDLEWLEAGLRQLDTRSRDLLGLKFGAGLKNRQIAVITGLSDSNVAVLVYRALNKLRANLERAAGNTGQEIDHERT